MSGVGLMPWEERSRVESRREFCEAALSGMVPFVVLAARYGIAPKTGYKWLARFRDSGLDGLVDRSRAPIRSPSRTDPMVEQQVCELRREHPAWGGRKIHHRLLKLGMADPPAASTITGILHRYGLIEPTETHRGPFIRFEAAAPNLMWQMDFKGWFTTGDGRCDPFDVLDDHSRFNLCLRIADQKESTITSILTGVFSRYGMPEQILCDNGSPWANTQPGFRWTGLGVWLIDLGVGLIHSKICHPQTIGKDERFHRTLDDEVLSTQKSWNNHADVQEAFDRWRPVYNHERPHEALGGAVPADRYQPSTRSMPTSIDPPEYPDGWLIRRVSDKAQIGLRNRQIRIGTAFNGRPVGLRPNDDGQTFDVHYRNEYIRTIRSENN